MNYSESPYLFLDTGNFMGTPSDEGDMKTRSLIEGMSRMGYRATGVGEREFSRGFEKLEGLRQLAEFPFVSGNFLYQKSGRTVFDPYVILDLNRKDYPNLSRPSVRVGVTSLVRFNPTFLKRSPSGDNVVIADPFERAGKIVSRLRKKADVVVVLTHMTKDDAHRLARMVPGIDLIVASYGGILTTVRESEGNTHIVYIGKQGKHLAELRMEPGVDRWETSQTLHYLAREYPEDAKLKAHVMEVLLAINEKNKRLADERAAKRAGSLGSGAAASAVQTTYVTSEVCSSCHEQEHQVWKSSTHSHAFDILVEKKADYNPDCVGCHVLGFRSRGGFEDARNTPEMIHVHCESCHGPGAKHIEDSSVPYGRTGGERSCLPCHTSENSPEFEFASYWKKVEH